MSDKSYFDRAIELFDEYEDYFCLSDADFPDEMPQTRQCEYVDKFLALICEAKGHAIGPDQCGIPEHDYCYRCRRLRTDIENDKK